MDSQLNELTAKFGMLETTRSQVINMLMNIKGENGEQFNLSNPISSIGISIKKIDMKVVVVGQLANKIKIVEDTILLPQSYIDNLSTSIDRLISTYKNILDAIRNIETNGGPGQLNSASFALTSKNGQASFQLDSNFTNIWKISDSVLSNLYPLINVISGEGYVDFLEFLKGFEATYSQIENQRNNISVLLKEAKENSRKLQDIHSKCIPLQGEIERLKSESDKDRKTLTEYASEGAQSITTIRGTLDQSEKLKSNVENYKSTFDNFQNQLDEREKNFASGTERQFELLKNINDTKKIIENLNQQASDMLSGATVAGLAGSFGDIKNSLSKELTIARWAFYCAIAFLFITVIPLAIYIIPSLGEVLNISDARTATNLFATHSQNASTSEFLGQILARALFLLPAVWLAKFTAARHAALFKLKEHYSYKYSLAYSVEGFKKQAGAYKDEIAATTFYELTFNPAERMDSKGDESRHPNPVMDWLMKKLGATYNGKD